VTLAALGTLLAGVSDGHSTGTAENGHSRQPMVTAGTIG